MPTWYAQAVFDHLWFNYREDTRNWFAQILTIVGPAGTGKTTMAQEICNRCGVHLENVDASVCEDELAGRTVEKFQAIYVKASETQKRTGIPQVIFWNDVDQGIGNQGRRMYTTINTQLLVLTLMQTTDNPMSVAGRDTIRLPMIMTCNNMSPLYGPLRRLGRMRTIRWEMTREEAWAIGRHILRGHLRPDQLDWLVTRVCSWTPAHFHELRATLLRLRARGAGKGLSAPEQILAAVRGDAPPLSLLQEVGPEILEAAVADVESGVEAARSNYTLKDRRRRP